MTILTKDNIKNVLESNDCLIVIDFYADWCGPCRMLAPIIEEIANERDDILVCKVNVDNEIELANKFGVESIPTVAFVKKNLLIDESIGFKTKEELNHLIEEYKNYESKAE